jgi:hypothetical protein
MKSFYKIGPLILFSFVIGDFTSDLLKLKSVFFKGGVLRFCLKVFCIFTANAAFRLVPFVLNHYLKLRQMVLL